MTLTNQAMYEELKIAMTEDLYNWLKIQYSDVCSNGDVIINRHINNMYNNIPIVDLYLIDHIYDTWKSNYVLGYAPDSGWAS